MACSDDRYMAAEPEPVYERIANRRWQIDYHYLPFKRDRWQPIGCTATHAFAVLQKDNSFTPVVMHLVKQNMLKPSQCLHTKRPFVSPWRRYTDSFFDFLGGCAYKDRMCLVLSDSLLLMDAQWRVHMRDNRIALHHLAACSMNGRYVVVVGVETGSSTQSMFVYDTRLSPPRCVLYEKTVEPEIVSVHLLHNIEHALLAQCADGRTRRLVIEKADHPPRYVTRDVGDMRVCTSSERPAHTKELNETGHIVQLIGDCFMRVRSKDDIERTMRTGQAVVDAQEYEKGYMVSHHADNSLQFFTPDLVHIMTIPWEFVAAPSLQYEGGVATILKPYASLGRCLDDPDTIALMASFGALVTIKLL